MKIDHLIPSNDNNIIVKVVLDGESEQELYWNTLKKYMMINGYFKEKYLTSRNEEDTLEFSKYWEEIDISYQDNFVVIGLYLRDRKDGTIIVWDVKKEEWSYILRGDNSYGVLLLPSFDLIFLLNKLNKDITKVTANKLSNKNTKSFDLASTFKEIKHFDPDEYDISAAGLMVSAKDYIIKEYGELGLFYSEKNKEVYCHVEGKLYTYKLNYILEETNKS